MHHTFSFQAIVIEAVSNCIKKENKTKEKNKQQQQQNTTHSQWNRIKSPDVNQSLYSQPIVDKVTKNI